MTINAMTNRLLKLMRLQDRKVSAALPSPTRDRAIAATLVSICALIISGVSAYFTYLQSESLSKSLYLHIRPELSIELTAFSKNDNMQPVLTVRNKSPVTIASQSADYVLYQFDKATKRFVAGGIAFPADQAVQGHVIFQKKLEPNEFVSAELATTIASGPTPRSIFVFVVFATHYRTGDMARFDNKKIFFFDNGDVFDEVAYASRPHFGDIVALVSTVQSPELGHLNRAPAQMIEHKWHTDKYEAHRKAAKARGDSRPDLPAPSGLRLRFDDKDR